MQKVSDNLTRKVKRHNKMELLVLFIFFSVMLITPCVTTQIHQDQSSSQDAHGSSIVNEVEFFPPSVPRKLMRVVLSVTIKEDDDATQAFAPDKSGKAYKKREKRNKEWMEASEYLTMDYRHVTRRRPIHNKSLPAAP